MKVSVSIDQLLHRQKISLLWVRDPNRYPAAWALMPSCRWHGLVRLYPLSALLTHFFRSRMGVHHPRILSLGPLLSSRLKKPTLASIYDLNCQLQILAEGVPCFASRKRLASNNHRGLGHSQWRSQMMVLPTKVLSMTWRT